MPFLLLAAGVLLGLYGLYRFFLNASPREIRALVLSLSALTVGLVLLFLALTGRLGIALGLLVATAPMLAKMLPRKKTDAAKPAEAGAMTRKEALEILNLDDSADKNAIQESYRKLMQKLHPDSEGSSWMAAKLNEARALLLKKR